MWGRCLQGYGSAAGGAPWGADGYSGQQGGEAARPNRLCRLPSLLAAMGGRGDLREGSHTSLSSHSRKPTRPCRSNQDPGECPVPGCSVSAAPIIEIYIYKSKCVSLHLTKTKNHENIIGNKRSGPLYMCHTHSRIWVYPVYSRFLSRAKRQR